MSAAGEEAGGYVVESLEERAGGDNTAALPTATMRVYVMTEARAKQIVEEGARAIDPKTGEPKPALRTYRAVSYEEMPPNARENMMRARASAS